MSDSLQRTVDLFLVSWESEELPGVAGNLGFWKERAVQQNIPATFSPGSQSCDRAEVSCPQTVKGKKYNCC